MTQLPTIATVAVWLLALAPGLQAQEQPPWAFAPSGKEGSVIYDVQSGRLVATNGVTVLYGAGVLSADRISVDQQTGDAIADGHVRIQEADEVWVGEHFHINFLTHQMETDKFRMGQPPSFAKGRGMESLERTNRLLFAGEVNTNHLAVTNLVVTTTNAIITADDIERPLLQVHAKRIVIYPGDKMVAHDAVLYIGKVPVFYWP